MNEPVVLVCALADAAYVVPGTIFTHECGRCRRAVMLAPSGQRMLVRYPDAIFLCGDCFFALPDSGDYIVGPAGSKEEITDEARRAQPNLRGRRN